jgi:choline dehydrogenase-like flavoprotein
MEHLEINCGEAWMFEDHNMIVYGRGKGISGPKFPPRTEISLTDKEQEKTKVLNGTISWKNLVNSRFFKPNIETWDSENPEENLSNWGGQNHKSFLGKIRMKLNDIEQKQNEAIEKAYQLYIRIEQQPNNGSKITLINENDELGMKKVNLHWNVTDLELNSIIRITELMGLELGSLDIGRVRLMEYIDSKRNPESIKFNGGWHHMGTTRMADSEKNGVVNADCRVFGIENLFIAGSSCFSTSGAVNPTYTIAALSVRLAEYLSTNA